ncbi:hypothetical protein BAE44_0007695 [Dichanthelium oligosanthes]|uniref:F-box domain-containing protein n=1 Tax=Dichanthelium oligosanthes TaxID=888268 RepID=A0A1E5W1T1_9POAL|nr:hypothetical protein BAE44_0007695 [Dichanthelium oligosanthes]
MDCSNPKRSAAAVPRLPEDAVLDILERLPVRSIHRFSCVSQRWCDLIADPVHRKRFPQTLEGFFCSDAENYFCGEFISLPGITAPLLDPSLSFLTKLPRNKNIKLLHSCNGLLFEHGNGKLGYIVCNPATEQWMAVPSAGWPSPNDCAPTYIVFDPAISLHFHLFNFRQNDYLGVIEARTFSSEARVWINCTSKQGQWQEGGGWKQWLKGRATFMGNTFVNGMLHFIVFHRGMEKYQIAGVGWEGKTCRVISWPDKHGSSALFLGQSQGHLYCMSGYQEGSGFYQSGISIWVLQDYDTEEWVLKHNVSFLKLFGQYKCRMHVDYNVVAIHPDCNWVFLVQHCNRKLIAYDMDSKKVHALRTFRHPYGLCTPYIPYYSELSALPNKH